MNVGSLFSGVGGIDLGLERAGMRVVWNAEQDEWCRGVLRHHWPSAYQYADVRLVGRGVERTTATGDQPEPTDAEQRRTRPVDLLCGGFPCQDLSVAGKRAGLVGARSGLFHEFARIAHALRPRWLLIENVPGLLSSNDGRDFGIVLHTLAELGYGVAWRVLDSRYFGVPQRRRRVFIIARAGGDPAGALRALCESCPGSPPASACSWQGAATRPGGRVAASLTRGSAASPGVNPPGRRQEDDVNLVLANALDRMSGGPDDNSAQANHLVPALAFNWQSGGDVRLGIGDRPTALGREQTPATFGHGGVRRLTPRECERLQGFPDDWTLVEGLKCPDSRRYAAMGNAVTVNVAEYIGRRILAVEAAA